MNKYISLLVAAVITLSISLLMSSCKDENKVGEMLFEVDSENLSQDFDKVAASVVLPVKTNLQDNDWKAEPSDSWIFVVKQSTSNGESGVKISVAANDTGSKREGTVKLISSVKNIIINITQYSGTDIVIEDDIAVKPSGGQASESQPGQGIENTWDGKFSTDGAAPYHSIWGQSANFPVTLDYYFSAGTEIDYLIYYTRSGNGNFGEVDIYLSEDEGHAKFDKYGSYNFRMKNSPTKVSFDETKKVTGVRFVVKSGLGNFVSCDEMQFFKLNSEKTLDKELVKVFTDVTCSELRSDATEENINALPDYFSRIAKALKDNTYDAYEKEFRIRSYEPYSYVEEWAEKLMTKKYGNLDNPTGISVNEGDELIVLVGDTYGQDVSLQCIWESGSEYKQTNVSGDVYLLSPGVNKLKMKGQGQLFVMYNTDLTSNNAKPIKIHIPLGSGKVTGFFDLKEHQTDEKYKELLSKATHKYFCVRGEKIIFYFHTSKMKEFIPDEILSAIHLWDDIIGWQQELMGIDDVRPSQVNNHIFAISPEGSYMWATDYCIGFVYSYLNNILLKDNVMAAKDNAWGPAHEIGHIHQLAIDWPGSTESSNNLFSNYILYKLGKYCSRGTELCMPKFADNCIRNDQGNITKQTLVSAHCIYNKPWWDFGDGHQGENTELHMRMNWQLWNYYHRCGHKPDFWPTLFKLMRDNRINSSNVGEKQLLFARMASEAAQEDLTEFFEMWGFFVPTDATIEQYGSYKIKITEEMVEQTKAYMKKFPKKAAPFYYLEDRKNGDVGLDSKAPDVGYYSQFEKGKIKPITKQVSAVVTGKNVAITNGDEAVAFEVYLNGKLAFFSTFFEFELPDELVGKNFDLKAVAADGSRVEIKK